MTDSDMCDDGAAQNLHADRNPLGTCALANEFKFRAVRVELLQVPAP